MGIGVRSFCAAQPKYAAVLTRQKSTYSSAPLPQALVRGSSLGLGHPLGEHQRGKQRLLRPSVKDVAGIVFVRVRTFRRLAP